MRILFDQGTPVPLRDSLPQHEVSTTYERGWSTLRNGELLDAAEREGYAILVTTDSNLRHQPSPGCVPSIERWHVSPDDWNRTSDLVLVTRGLCS